MDDFDNAGKRRGLPSPAELNALGAIMHPRALNLLRAALPSGSTARELSVQTGRPRGETQKAIDQLQGIGVLTEENGRYSTNMQRLVSLMPYSGG